MMISHNPKHGLRVLAALFFLGTIAAWFTMPQLVESAYQGSSWTFLNKIISGQDKHSLQKYLDMITQYLIIFSVAGLTASAVVFALSFDRVKGRFATIISPTPIELLPAILILLIALAEVSAELVTLKYDWDIDHMMYFGGRLLAGDLHWTVEFDDKLPVAQALFALPAKAHSIRVWQIMSALSIFAGCVSAYMFLVAAIHDYLPELSKRTAKTVAFYTAVLIVCSYALLPGGITHINPMAASLAMMAIAFADVARRAFPNSRARFYSSFFIGAFCASVAIGIRPYFLYPLVFAGVWAALKVDLQAVGKVEAPPAATRRLTPAPIFIWAICWIACIGLFGLAANAFPYLVIGRLDILQAGLKMLAQDLNPNEIMSVLKMQVLTIKTISFKGPEFIALVFAVWGVSTVVIPSSVLSSDNWRSKRNAALDIGYIVILCPLLLELAFLARHFWPHYLQFFVPFTGLGVGFLGAHLVAQGVFKLSRVQMLHFVLASLIVIFVSALEETAKSVNAILPTVTSRHYREKRLAIFQRFLATRGETERDFLNPSHMYFHWQLGEPRHGFPHAANTKHIMWGWWRNVEVPAPFHLPTDRDAYCALIEENGPSLVVELSQSDVIECFSQNADSKYVQVNTATAFAATDLWIFERTP